MALETLRVRGAKVDLWVAGEAAPRRFEQADATVRLGRGYHTLALDLTTLVHERDPATYKCAPGGLSVSLGPFRIKQRTRVGEVVVRQPGCLPPALLRPAPS